MQKLVVALFGEAEKGAFQTIYYLKTVSQLHQFLGKEPKNSCGISTAIQWLNYEHELLYLRVEEEGFSLKDYYAGLKLLECDFSTLNLCAVGMPGMGNQEVIHECFQLCDLKGCIMLSNEQDLYDFMTESGSSM